MLARNFSSGSARLNAHFEADRAAFFDQLNHINSCTQTGYDVCQDRREELDDEHCNYRRKIHHPEYKETSQWFDERLGYGKQEVKKLIAVSDSQKWQKESQEYGYHIKHADQVYQYARHRPRYNQTSVYVPSDIVQRNGKLPDQA